MFYNAQNNIIKINDTDMDYISFGNGEKPLVILPGLGDAFKSVKGMALTFAMMYKIFSKNFRVYVFSRKNKLDVNYSTRDMAKDQAKVMKELGITNACIMGVSQGGMIAQYIAIDYPELVDKLILAVTVSKPNETTISLINSWLDMAKANNFKNIFIDTAEKSYSLNRLKQYRPFYGILTAISKPKSLDKFIIQANACLNHNSYNELDKVKCPTFVIGGSDDKVVGNNASIEIAEKISNCKIKIYDGLGHATYEEARDFNQKVLEFIVS